MDAVVTAGFPEFWTPVYRKYKRLFECAYQLAPESQLRRSEAYGSCLIVDGGSNQFRHKVLDVKYFRRLPWSEFLNVLQLLLDDAGPG